MGSLLSAGRACRMMGLLCGRAMPSWAILLALLGLAASAVAGESMQGQPGVCISCLAALGDELGAGPEWARALWGAPSRLISEKAMVWHGPVSRF